MQNFNLPNHRCIDTKTSLFNQRAAERVEGDLKLICIQLFIKVSKSIRAF